MLFKLHRHELPVESFSFRSPQRVAWLEIPGGQDIPQDWGPGPKEFRLSGKWFAREGGVGLALEFDALKDGRTPVIFRLDDTSWKVQCQDFSYNRLPGGAVEFTLELRELEAPEHYVFEAQPELRTIDVADTYLARLRLEARAYWFRGISNHVYEWLTDVGLRLAEIREWLADVVALKDLPWAAISGIKTAAGIAVGRMDLLTDLTEQQMETAREYSDESQNLARALEYARAIRVRMALLRTACEAIPRQEQRYIVNGQDTLATIAAAWNQEHGTTLHWSEIARANSLYDLSSLHSGQQLTIPS